MSKEYKIFVETSVLLAASLKTKEWKSTNCNRSEKLLEFLRDKINKRIGITTDTVEREARNTLEKAVMKELEDRSKNAVNRQVIFERSRVALNECDKNLNEHISILLREPIIPEIVNLIKKEVDSFYRNLEYQAISNSQIVIRGGDETLKKIHEESIDRDPILRLQKNYPAEKDRRILSEAIYIKRNYDKNFVETDIYFASNDQHFSPMQVDNKKDDTLSRKIEERFQIECDWPERILKHINA